MRGVWMIVAALVVHPTALLAEDREMSLQDVLAVALGNNLDVALAHADAEVAREEILIARADFESRVVGDARVEHEQQPASTTSMPFSASRGVSSIGLQGRWETGLDYEVAFGVEGERNSSPFDAYFSPSYTTSVAFTLAQPLMRGAWSAARLPIEAADRRHRAREADVRVRLDALIRAVEVSYWNLAVAFKAREARESSLKLAQDQLADSNRLVQLGTIANLDVVEAQSGVSRRQQELALTAQQVANAEGDLLDILQKADWDAQVVPQDELDRPPIKTSIDEQMAIATKNRPDLAAAQAQIDAEAANVALASDRRAPALDLILKGGVFGFAGSLQQNYATQAIADGSLMPPYTLDPAYRGGLSRSFANLIGGDYAMSLGLRLQLPLHNSLADAQYQRQLRVLEKARLMRKSLLARVRSELHRALALLVADENMIKVSDEAVAVNTQLLEGMRKRFSLGGATSFDVLRVADELTRAQIAAARARASYRVSVARLAAANGTLLQMHGLSEPSIGK